MVKLNIENKDMINYNVYPIYRAAPIIIRKQLLRKKEIATIRLLLDENNNTKKNLNLNMKRLRTCNLALNDQGSFVLNRKFTSSPYNVYKDLHVKFKRL